MPSFEQANGPVLVPRFPYQISDLSVPDGLVHQLFTITGRSDNLPGCTLTQPNFTQAGSQGNLVFRQPLPTFGDGYIEIIENTDILNNLNSNLAQKQAYGIGGAANIADDGSISRLGWKAQWRAILPAAGAEENVEMGVTNEMFPTETDQSNPSCVTNPVPEDYTNYAYTGVNGQVSTYTNFPWNFPEGADRDAIFIRFLEQPTPGTCIADTAFGETAAQTCSNGQQQFKSAGCALCHTVSYTTPAGSIPSMGHIKAYLYSDLLLHHMGPCLADNVVQGVAQGDMWRTPPLWNVGQRYWFLHDGRTNNIVTAIEDHYCTGNSQYPISEANQVVTKFNGLSAQNQQDLINFLRSL
ncbi:MAG TPA: di-heme oxidoredictase family protein [Terriglobia bacterium]|nr:di-heme oxidoredictase family protein [Terriglobia bacterium]